MATETSSDNKLQATFLERLTEGFTSFISGIVKAIGRVFGLDAEKTVRELGYTKLKDPDNPYRIEPGSILDRINQFEEKMTALSAAELKGLSEQFKQRLKAGETLEDLLPEVFAACRESARRNKNMRHYDVQMVGGVILHRRGIAEMVTGEGKTLVATLPAVLNALTGKGVHVITVNDYLARRDCEWMLPIYQGLGITAGYIQSDMDAIERRKAYDCDITYGTNSEFGFDYLRDNMKPARWGDPNFHPYYHQVQRGLNYAIIDEVDNILIDEARTPLIISGPAHSDIRRYEDADRIARQLTELEKKARAERAAELAEAGAAHPATQSADAEALPAFAIDRNAPRDNKEPMGVYFELKEKERSCHLTDLGVRKAEELAGVESFYTPGNMEWPHLIDNALKAHHLYKRDRNYLVMDHEGERKIIIVDEFTGRAMFGRQWSDGLHQAIEAKHKRDGVQIKQETQTLATITLQNYFKLYNKLAGMTGTAMTEAGEFWKIYKLDVVAIPTNKPLRRVNSPDLIYRSDKEKWDCIIEEIERIHKFDVLVFPWKGEFVQAQASAHGGEPPEWLQYHEILKGVIAKGVITKETETEVELQIAESKTKVTVPKAQIERIERKGRPMLIGTTDVKKSEHLSGLLKRRGIKHELLNAKPENVGREAEIVAQAGRLNAVTISTNMAGRGTDIILGGNPETLAWAMLKDQYPTRLDIPEDVWKKTVDDIEAKEKMKEEGRKVAALGGLHIVGTERHESRRIDNQLRGRAGRQGDPGSSRFYLSLQDDLMRLFAGEWVANVLTRLGMQDNQAIESRMVSRRIEGAQKKVEEYHFEQRKNLLDYDEVMDVQRKRVYGKRQQILNDANCKIEILEMIEEQAGDAVGKFLDESYGPDSFAEFAANRLGVEFDGSDFQGMAYADAVGAAKEKAVRMIPTVIQEGMDENLSDDEDPKDWKWQEMARLVNARYGTKYTDRQLKQIGKENLAQTLLVEAEKFVQAIDLSEGQRYLEADWGLRSLADWVRTKFGIVLGAEDFAERDPEPLKELILKRVRETYRQKEIEFPVQVALSSYMSEKPTEGGKRQYDREGLFRWAKLRLPGASDALTEEEFRTQSRAQLKERLLEVSKRYYPEVDQSVIDEKLEEAYSGAKVSEAEDAEELSGWAKEVLRVEVPASELTGISQADARQKLWNAFDRRYRPEMHRMERTLLLDQLDSSWKKHLLTMDHLRSGIGLWGYAQVDPKTKYKQEGKKEFDMMWEALQDRVTDSIFRVEDQGEEEIRDAL